MQLTLGFSPCPNDTFIFDALVNGKINTHGLTFNYVMEDVETLNLWAIQGKLDITKLSFSTFLKVYPEYGLLHSGSALGNGVGPLLVARKNIDTERIHEYSIAIPGENTSANLLLSLAFPNAKAKKEMIFSDIEDAVLTGQVDAGLIIHESRFTYHQKGLIKILDLGDWWAGKSKAPIPLGGIAIKRNLEKKTAEKVDYLLKESLEYAWRNYPELSSFVKENAQEMSAAVMKQHIDLYVNEFSLDVGEQGSKAILKLFEEAHKAGAINFSTKPSIFY